MLDSTNGSQTQLETSQLVEEQSPPYSDFGDFDTVPSDGLNERIEKFCALLETREVTVPSSELLDRLLSALDPLFSPWQRRNDSEHAAMRLEDLQATYLRHSETRSRMIADLQEKCNSMSLIVKSSRERALLIHRLEDFNRKISDTDEFTAVRKMFEEAAISYWLVAKETTQVNRHLETYVKSILQGVETDPNSYAKQAEEEDLQKLLETIAKQKRVGTEKDVTIKMCMMHLNKLSNTCSAILAQDLPRIQKYPELELPDLCKALTRVVSQLATRNKENDIHSPRKSGVSGSSFCRRSPHRALSLLPFDTKDSDPEDSRGQHFGSLSLETEKQRKTTEMQLEEVMFERDFFHKQNTILKQLSREYMGEEDQASLFEKIDAKEESLRVQIETLAEEREQLQKSETDFEVQMNEKTAQIAKIEALNQRLAKKLQVQKDDKGVNTTEPVSFFPEEEHSALLQSIQTLKQEIATLKSAGNSRPPSNLKYERRTGETSAREVARASEAIAKSRTVLELAQVKLRVMERQWSASSESKLQGSMSARRQSCSPTPYVTLQVSGVRNNKVEIDSQDQEKRESTESEDVRNETTQTMDSSQGSKPVPTPELLSLHSSLYIRDQPVAEQEAAVTQQDKELQNSFKRLRKDEGRLMKRKKEAITVISSGWKSLLSEAQRIDVYRHQVRPPLKITKRSGP